jgi:release factor glutamine methyltransferase
LTVYSHHFRPSTYTTMLLRVITEHCPGLPMDRVLDVGVGSGIFLSELGHLGAHELWGVDIDPEALTVSDSLLNVEAASTPRYLLEGDMWEPLPSTLKFNVIVANLPHFPARVIQSDRPETWAGGNGRNMMDRFIQALPERLKHDGVAFVTHHDLVGFQHTTQSIRTAGLVFETMTIWTVFETPERMGAVSEQTLAAAGESLRYRGGYAFVDARVLAIRPGPDLKLQLVA